MSFQPADNLKNRTFVGLIISQFLAGFNDQAIHIAATFYAIHHRLLSEADAIFLMQILFYAPWAIFCTSSAYLADRFSKTTSIVVWKFSEIVISLILTAGFVLGTVYEDQRGVEMVVACVFLMGMHAAFFSPAKYGAMPQVLQPHMLSRGNGVLESSTFLANILGLVVGGALSYLLRGQEYWIGVVLLVLSIIGAAASLMMAKLPPSDPSKKLDLVKPLVSGYRNVFGSRPLALSVLGIAFFVFMVSYMRATMLLHGQTHNPPWTEFKTSLIVASVALGVGIGAPLAGWLSGGKIELGMVPLGCIGMILGSVVGAFFLQFVPALVIALLIIGYFSGFYMVPLYAMLQHRSPKTAKGEIVAFSNFVNVIGAMGATALFKVLILIANGTGLTPLMNQRDVVAAGYIIPSEIVEKHHHVVKIAIHCGDGKECDTFEAGPLSQIKMPARGVFEKSAVIVSEYQIGDVTYSVVRFEGEPMAPAYDNQSLPKYLFCGAGVMTFAILILLCWKLPDFFVRMIYWMKSIGRHQLKAVGMDNLPTSGPVVLATNCDRLESTLMMISATDRHLVMILAEKHEERGSKTLRRLAERTSLLHVEPTADWSPARPRAVEALKAGDLLGLTIDGAISEQHADAFLAALVADVGAPILPTWCGSIGEGKTRVVFGEPLPASTNVAVLRTAIEKLGAWIRENDHTASAAH